MGYNTIIYFRTAYICIYVFPVACPVILLDGFRPEWFKSRAGTQTSLAGRILAVVRRHYWALLQGTAYGYPAKAYLFKNGFNRIRWILIFCHSVIRQIDQTQSIEFYSRTATGSGVQGAGAEGIVSWPETSHWNGVRSYVYCPVASASFESETYFPGLQQICMFFV